MVQRSLFIVVLLFLFSCGNTIHEKIEETHPDNTPKLISYYQEIYGREVLVEQKSTYPNGNIKIQGKFKNERREGEWIAYFEDGKVQSKGVYVKGKRTGIAKVYFPNGQLYYEGQYENNQRVGHWKFYNEQGELVTEKDY